MSDAAVPLPGKCKCPKLVVTTRDHEAPRGGREDAGVRLVLRPNAAPDPASTLFGERALKTGEDRVDGSSKRVPLDLARCRTWKFATKLD